MTEEAKVLRREYARKWRAENREKIRAYDKKWRSKNPEKVSAIQDRYWQKKADELEGKENEEAI